MFIGIDLGTSGVKVILTNTEGELVASASSSLALSMPHPMWSEQDPQHWWDATCECLDTLSKSHNLATVSAIGLAGQMHGATLLGRGGNVLRPAILWNDGRTEKECVTLTETVPAVTDITGNLVMPGFTAPKLLWVKKHEPEVFSRIDKVLLPKDYLRFKLSGDYASDMSDSAGTIWLDVGKRDWSDSLLDACGLSRQNMPDLYEGNQVTGSLLPSLSKRWGMKDVAIVAGAGDNAAGAIGCGIINPGQAMLSLGTSGVYFAVTREFRSNAESAVHSFCHALPDRWHLMSVMLSAASCLQWYAANAGYKDVGELTADIENNTGADDDATPYFLPYLTGERTPHNNPAARGMFFGLSASTTRAHMARAVMEGVSMALADGIDAVHGCGVQADGISLIGGGVRSSYWCQMLANVSGLAMNLRQSGDVGPALGAARLAHLAMNPEIKPSYICPFPKLVKTFEPDNSYFDIYLKRRQKFRELYFAVEPHF